MKVSELIEILRKYDENMEVEIAYSDDGGFYQGSREPEPVVDKYGTNGSCPLLLL